jgi:hypothetical protein
VYYDSSGGESELTPDVYSYTPVQPTSSEQGDDWMSLGVFAAGKDAESAGYTNLFFELALNRNGDIAGTFFNSGADQTYLLEGDVDQSTQEAAWTLDNVAGSPIMSTGLYNLTQDVAPLRVRFSNGEEQYWTLVRLQQ